MVRVKKTFHVAREEMWPREQRRARRLRNCGLALVACCFFAAAYLNYTVMSPVTVAELRNPAACINIKSAAHCALVVERGWCTKGGLSQTLATKECYDSCFCNGASKAALAQAVLAEQAEDWHELQPLPNPSFSDNSAAAQPAAAVWSKASPQLNPPLVECSTTQGTIVIEVRPDWAPLGAARCPACALSLRACGGNLPVPAPSACVPVPPACVPVPVTCLWLRPQPACLCPQPACASHAYMCLCTSQSVCLSLPIRTSQSVPLCLRYLQLVESGMFTHNLIYRVPGGHHPIAQVLSL